MAGFLTPFKRRPNQFNYTPRFYDPKKEERDRRRAELRGARPEGHEGEYVVGEYIQRQREARAERRGRRSGGPKSMWFMIVGVVIVFLLAYMLIPRLVGAFVQGGTQTEMVKPVDEFDEFDPYAPIRIVPNDYKGD
ncbi:MAG: hypothetical protein R3Y44_07640 [Rikenellaceae bacterium]